jgi:hypothetical protein
MQNIKRELFSIKNTFSLLKNMSGFCLIVFIYQFIEITNNYLSFPIEVKLNISDENTIDLPQITFCLCKSKSWNKKNSTHFQFEESFGEEFSNYTFRQIFDQSFNLSSALDCSGTLIDNDNKYYNKCEEIGQIFEFISGNSEYGNCFTYFNINYRMNSSINYKMDKSSFIEFDLSLENFNEFLISREYKMLDTIYLRVQSSQSKFSDSFLTPIEINFQTYKLFTYKFSRNYVKSVGWPYEANCIDFEAFNEKKPSFLDCVNSCILDRMMKRYKCFHPENNFGIDVVLSEKTEKMRICVNHTKNESLLRNLTKKCLRNCRQNCITEYTNFFLHSEDEKKNSKTKIRLQITNTPIYEYIMCPKLSLVNYASNFGSIMSMWFGFSVINSHKLLEKLLIFPVYMLEKFYYILNLDKILRIILSNKCMLLLILIIDYFKLIEHKIQKFKWKLLFKVLCILCFVYQTIEMTTEYLRYETLVEVKTKSYSSNEDSNPLPALSLCKNVFPENGVENDVPLEYRSQGKDFERFFKNYELIKKNLKVYISYRNFNEVLNNQTLVSDYLNVIDFKQDFTFGTCSIESGTELMECENFLNLIISHSKDIKCYTFNSQLSDTFKHSLEINGSISLTYYFEEFLSIHDINDLPSFPFSKMSSMRSQRKLLYDKMHFIRLPAPYDTDCHNYNNEIRSKSHCLNQLIHKMFLKKHNCLPKNHEFLTYVVDNYNYTHLIYKFCSDSINIEWKKLMSKCHKNCIEDIYEMLRFNGRRSYLVETLYPKYLSFEHKPKLEFMQYLIKLGGLLGLWHGISLKDLKNLVLNSIHKINFKQKFMRKFGKFLILSNSPFRTMKKFKIKVILILIFFHE